MGFYPQSLNAGVTPPLQLYGSSLTEIVYAAALTGDTFPRFQVQANGHIGFGTGSAASGTAFFSPATGKLQTAAEILISPAGNGLAIALGANGKLGSGTLASGTVTISNTSVKTGSMIFLTDTSNGADLGVLSVGTVTAGTGFVVNSSNSLDTGTFNYLIVETA